MTIDYQFEPAEIRALAKERQHPTPATWSRLYYFGILPTLTVGLAAEIQSFTIAAVFTLLFIATAWCIQERSRQSFWREVYSDENLLFSTRRRSVTLTSDGIRDSSNAAEILYR